MHTLFHDWRRKVGVVTLVMALVLFAFWMQSNSDGVSISTSRAVSPPTLITPRETYDEGAVLEVNYLALITPLAILSAYLLLWKPRKPS